jgi:hypothetical protein
MVILMGIPHFETDLEQTHLYQNSASCDVGRVGLSPGPPLSMVMLRGAGIFTNMTAQHKSPSHVGK